MYIKTLSMKFIESTNALTGETINISYYDYGTGKPVVLIHGWPLSKEMWEYQTEPLVNAGLRVIAYDRRGFGKSDKPWAGYDYDSFAYDLHALITQLNLDNVTLVGFSMGGGEVARYFSRYNGEHISKAVLVSSVVPYLLKTEDNPEGVAQEQFDGMINGLTNDRIGFVDDFSKPFFGIGFLNHPVSNALWSYYLSLAAAASPKATKDCITAFGTTDFRKDAAAMNVPVLIIHGDSDKIIPIEIAGNKAAEIIPNNQLIVYDNAPHGLFYTHRQRLSNDLISFITTGTVSANPVSANGETLPDNYVVLPSNDEGLVTRDVQ
jgi:pimeloyl-ACP methyl ester carboxylesterase